MNIGGKQVRNSRKTKEQGTEGRRVGNGRLFSVDCGVFLV